MAVYPVEQGPVVVPPTPQTVAPPAKSRDVEDRLRARRQHIAVVRHRLVGIDLAMAAVVATSSLLLGHGVAAAAAASVSAVVFAHVCGADGPRSMVRLRSVGKAAVAVCAAACVVVALLGARSAGLEILTGSALAALAHAAAHRVVGLPRFAPAFGLGRRRRLIVGDPQALERMAVRRSPAVEAGEVILVRTRADRPEPQVDTTRAPEQEQRRERDERSGPSGLVERVVSTALDNSVERVTVIPGASWQRRQLRELSWLLDGTGIDIVISTSLDGIAPHRVDIVEQDGRLMIKVGSGSPRGTHAFVKGLLDRLLAALLLVLVSPVLVVVAVVVRLDSRGPAVFRQSRVREGGATFTMYKFRTMCVDAEAQLDQLQELNKHDAAQLFKIDDDPRITRAGHVLRKTSLDELPQLLNVLKGEMSLIGPRPALPREVEMYDYVARRRLAVKPGITGLWQVSGRSRLGWDESIGFDLDYVDNWSPGTDAVIAVRTLRAVMTGDGAV